MTAKKNATTSKKTVSSAASSNAGLGPLVQEMSAYLDQAQQKLGPEAPSLTGPEKRRTAKARKGAEKILAALGPIAQQHGLESPSLNVAAMNERMAHAETLQPLQSRLQKITKRVDDEVFSAHSDAWGMGLQLYTLMKHRAKGDGELAASLEPVTKMFAYRHPSVKGAKPTKLQTRAKQKLKGAVALAERHDVPLGAAGSSAPPVSAIATATGAVPTVAAPAPAIATVPPPVVVTTGAGSAGAAPAGVTVGAAPAVSAPAASPVPGATGGVSVTVNHS